MNTLSKGDEIMNKKELIFLGASILMVNNESHSSILSQSGQDAFKKYFTVYEHLLEDLYEAFPDNDLKK
jgi:hypothetical protein